MKKIVVALFFLLTGYSACAIEAGFGLMTASQSMGDWGAFRWDLGKNTDVIPGIFFKASTIRVNTMALNDELHYHVTKSDKGELGIFFRKERDSIQAYLGFGVGVLYPDKDLADSSSFGGVVSVGANLMVWSSYGVNIEQTLNWGFGKAEKIAGRPDVFNTAAVSLGLIGKF
jgi:hypothetical protein